VVLLRPKGNTTKVPNWIEDWVRSECHEVDEANNLDYSMRGFSACMACNKGTVALCSIQDDTERCS
jgi:multimeric flavodoxin WrbA